MSPEVEAMIDVLAEHCIDQVEHHNEGTASAQQLSVHDKQLLLISVADRLKEAADALNDL